PGLADVAVALPADPDASDPEGFEGLVGRPDGRTGAGGEEVAEAGGGSAEEPAARKLVGHGEDLQVVGRGVGGSVKHEGWGFQMPLARVSGCPAPNPPVGCACVRESSRGTPLEWDVRGNEDQDGLLWEVNGFPINSTQASRWSGPRNSRIFSSTLAF